MDSVEENTRVKTPKERLAEIAEESKQLKKQISEEVTKRKAESAEHAKFRDERIAITSLVLDKVQSSIYSYNKLGKKAKDSSEIIKDIVAICSGG